MKPGVKTTEWWTAVVVLVGALATLLKDLEPVVQCVAVATAGIVAVAYILSRSTVKRAAASTPVSSTSTTRRRSTPDA